MTDVNKQAVLVAHSGSETTLQKQPLFVLSETHSVGTQRALDYQLTFLGNPCRKSAHHEKEIMKGSPCMMTFIWLKGGRRQRENEGVEQ